MVSHYHQINNAWDSNNPNQDMNKCIEINQASTTVVVGDNAITLDHLRRYFHLPIADAAKHFNTCTTALKKVCRKLNINKWPYRQILSLTKTIQSLEMASLNEALDDRQKQQYRQQINMVRKTIAEVIHNPTTIADMMSKRVRDDGEDQDTATAPIAAAVAGKSSAAKEEGSPPVQGSSSGGKASPDDNVDASVAHIILAATALIARSGKDLSKKRKSSSRDELQQIEGAELSSRVSNGGEEGQRVIAGEALPAAGTAGHVDRISAQPLLPAGSVTAPPYLSLASSAVGNFPEVGNTLVHFNPHYDNIRTQFDGPVQLAPLQRKVLRPNFARSVVPLMEPDIGCHFRIEFVPQFVLALLQKTLLDKRILVSASHSSGQATNALEDVRQQPRQQLHILAQQQIMSQGPNKAADAAAAPPELDPSSSIMRHAYGQGQAISGYKNHGPTMNGATPPAVGRNQQYGHEP